MLLKLSLEFYRLLLLECLGYGVENISLYLLIDSNEQTWEHLGSETCSFSLSPCLSLILFWWSAAAAYCVLGNLVMWCYCSARLFSMLIYIPVGLTTWQFFYMPGYVK